MNDLRDGANRIFRDLHARNLAIPAGILLLLIVLAIVALPKSASPVSSVTAAPHQTAQATQRAAVAAITVNANTPLGGERLVTFGAIDPFSPKGAGAKCKVSSFDGVKVVTCTANGMTSVLACEGPSCGTGGTGSAGGTGESGPVDTPPPDNGNGGNPLGEETVYVVDVTLDGKTYKNLEAGDGIPTTGVPTMFYAGASTSGKSAQFLVVEGLSVQGAEFDADLGLFTAQEGDTVVLTDEAGTVYQFKLKDIAKK